MSAEKQAIVTMLVVAAVSCVAVFVITEIRARRRHRKLIAGLDAMARGEAQFSRTRRCKEIVG